MPEIFGEITTSAPQSFVFNFVAGRTYYLELEGAATGAGTLANPLIGLLGPGGLSLSDDDGGVGNNARLVFTATTTFDYTVNVSAAPGSSPLGSFRLGVFEDDYRSTVEGTGALGAIRTGASTTATIHYTGDEDLYATTLVNGLTYTFEARGLTSNNGTLADPILSVVNGADVVLDANDDRAPDVLDSLITFRATTTGTHYLKVGAFDDGAGTLRLLVSEGSGTSAADTIVGSSATDAINGLGGNDNIRGGASADLLKGGTGVDILTGGTGGDTFRFLTASESVPGARDSIVAGDGAVAFEGVGAAAGDRIDLAGIDANETVTGNQTFLFGGTGIGRLSLTTVGTDTIVQGNTDADAAFEFELLIADGTTLSTAYTAADFVL